MSSSADNVPPPEDGATRHVLTPESELRIEVPFGVSVSITLRHGSAEIFGAELPQGRPVRLSGAKVAVYTWHGCGVDVTDEDRLDIVYVSDETESNVAYVNTHAQLEAMRDEALSSSSSPPSSSSDPSSSATNDDGGGGSKSNGGSSPSPGKDGPRVLIVGPDDCGKSSLARVLTAYAVKLGRTPILVDLDASSNMLSAPGTLAAMPVSSDVISAECYATNSIMGGGASGNGGGVATAMPLALWYGSQDLNAHPDLYKAQCDKLGSAINGRLGGDPEARASGLIVNSPGWMIQDLGYEYLLHAIESFRINVVLVLGHDRLYSMIGTHFKKEAQRGAEGGSAVEGSSVVVPKKMPKLIKLPRSGGVVSRDAAFRRAARSQCIRQYFYGRAAVATGPPNKSSSDGNASAGGGGGGGGTGTASSSSTTPPGSFSPCLVEASFADVRIHRLSNVSLSASLLPISAKQSTDPIQLTDVSTNEITPKFQHSVMAVCHPGAVARYEESGSARDLYLAGAAGFVVVEKVNADRETMSLLSPCAGSLPSNHLLVGDIFWME